MTSKQVVFDGLKVQERNEFFKRCHEILCNRWRDMASRLDIQAGESHNRCDIDRATIKHFMEVDDINATTDGRKLRSEDSKRRIVSAMLELVREGRMAPTAEEVANRAEVGLRTVFSPVQGYGKPLRRNVRCDQRKGRICHRGIDFW